MKSAINYSSSPNWVTPAPSLALPAGLVHIWRVDLDLLLAHRDALTTLLSSDEFERANRFRFEQHRTRYSIGRAILRVLIGRYLACPPHAVEFRYSSLGKPHLDRLLRLSFNLSRSHEMALYAFTIEGDLGIDIEKQDAKVDIGGIAQNFFAPGELRLIEEVEEQERSRRFFAIWARKEAYLKAVGSGLATPLNTFSTAVDMPIDGYQLYSFNARPGFAAAVAAKPKPERLLFFDLDQASLP